MGVTIKEIAEMAGVHRSTVDKVLHNRPGVSAVGDILEEYQRKNIKLICYETYPEILELLKKGIVTATIDSEIEEQGRKALEVLMEYLIYGRKPEKRHLYSEIKILLRESL